ncbi:hypothetical protein IAT38_000144 [Cryptococcus sp. DSM 104549]
MTSLQDLPSELLRRIVCEVEKKHALLLVCKQTSIIAAEHLYTCLTSGEEEHHSPCGYVPPLSRVLEGLQHDGPSSTAPFGRDAKMMFLQSARDLQHAFGVYICFRESSSDEKVLERLIHVFQTLHASSTIAFPALKTLQLSCTGWSSITPPNRTCAFALARVSKPEVCHWPFVFGLDELPPYVPTCTASGGGRAAGAGEGEGKGYRDLRFAQGHVPERVVHLPYKVPSIPPVCYGTLNVVSFSQLWSHPAWSVTETVNYLISILRFAHPEVFSSGEGEAALEDAEREKREKTSWAFLWVGRFTKKEGKTYGTMMRLVEEGLWEGVPAMRERVTFSVGEVGK